MFDLVTMRVSDRATSRRFYETLLGEPTFAGEASEAWNDFSIAEADGVPVTRNVHVAFAARSREEVDAFWQRGVDAGYRSDGEPGLRPQYKRDYYGGFLLDPDGNSVESVHRPGRTEFGPPIDHLWLGVADLGASSRFWKAFVRVLGLGTGSSDDLFIVGADRRHFALVADGRPPTQNLHLRFPVPDDATVARFHRIAIEAGYRDDGVVVLDPDGNGVEAVNRDR
jgi:catechol 2,3-dioxygenase-like lactoylglutathione lyase family enzyme